VPDSAPDPRPSERLRRAFTLTGVVPLGAFLVVHVVANLRALDGDAAFDRAVRAFGRIPLLGVVEALVVFAPLLFHAAFGLWLVVRRAPLRTPSPYPRAIGIAVRVTGVLAVAFLAMHLPELRFRDAAVRPGGGALGVALDADLSSMWHGLPWRAVAYLLGAACVCFHFAAGLWAFFATTSRGEGPRTRRRAAWWSAAVGAALWVLFADVVVFHATGSRLLGGAAHDDTPTSPCPAPSASTSRP
jgi:succinate dehydrogenase/fumarate reductase cytochrome b subunit (b558 family)